MEAVDPYPPSLGALYTQIQARQNERREIDLSSVAGSPDTIASFRHETSSNPFVIALAGGTASGKTTVCNLIMQRLHDQCVALIPQDSFYKALSPEEHELANRGEWNFDNPRAIDEQLMTRCIDTLLEGRATYLPVYDFTTHSRSQTEKRRVEPAQVIIIEGILTLHFKSLLQRAHMKIFVDSDDDVRLARRIQRDVVERGRSMEDVLDQYRRYVKPAHASFIAPSKRIADIVIPWHHGDNIVAVDLIVGYVQSHMVKDPLLVENPNLHLLESTFQMRGMHTIMRDRNTSKGDFIFFSDRIIRLVVEYALGLLPAQRTDIATPTGAMYHGLTVQARVCGVSIIRSGEAMEAALRSCWKGIDIGKILVHRRRPPTAQRGPTTTPTEEPSKPRSTLSHELADDAPDVLIYSKLPHDIAERHVLLMDPILGTGNTASRAIQVRHDTGTPVWWLGSGEASCLTAERVQELLGRGCKPSKILLLTLIASREGIQHFCTAFPDVKVITTEIDRAVGKSMRVVPGIGEFGDRYFCH